MVHLDTAKLDDGHFSTSEVRRPEEPCLSTSRIIAFTRNQYREPPNLAAGFCSLDVSCEGPIRANLVADSITNSHFRIAIETWGKGILYEAGATWLEHKANSRDCIFGQSDTDWSEPPTISAKARSASPVKKQAINIKPAPKKKSSKAFAFPRPFKETPQIVCWLNRLDLVSSPDHNYKVWAFADGITPEGFTAHLNTWDDGELHGAAMCWIAFPKRKKHVDSGRFSTNDVRKRTNPRPRTTARVKFKQRFDRTPTVLAALNRIDAAGNADLRVKVDISEVDREGFRWTLETWEDSTLYAAGASWIALGFA